MYDDKISVDEAYDAGWQDGYARGRDDAYDEAYAEVSAQYEQTVGKLYAGLMELNARLDVAEKKLGISQEEC